MGLSIWNLEKNSDKNIIFSLSRCTSNWNQCIRKLTRESVKKFYEKIKEFESKSLQQMQDMPKNCWRCKDWKGTSWYKKLVKIDNSLDNYYHFRIKWVSRVFWWTAWNRFYILLFDPKGDIYPKAHK